MTGWRIRMTSTVLRALSHDDASGCPGEGLRVRLRAGSRRWWASQLVGPGGREGVVGAISGEAICTSVRHRLGNSGEGFDSTDEGVAQVAEAGDLGRSSGEEAGVEAGDR